MKLHELAAQKLNHTGRINTTNMTKLETKQLLGEELTLTDTEMVNLYTGETFFAVCIFAEYPDCYYLAGTALTELCAVISSDDEAFTELNLHGLKIKLETVRSKNKRDYTAVKLA